MQELEFTELLNGRTGGRHSGLFGSFHFECLYRITNLKDELIRYTGPSNWIADLLN